MNEFIKILPIALGQVALVLTLAPLVNTAMKKWKAGLQGRQGPPWLQSYYDLLKYFRKETVVSDQASALFLLTPLIVFATMGAASLLVPTLGDPMAFQDMGGMIVFVMLLGLGRFFLASAAMEPGSGFGGMAASREMMLAALVEPVMLLALFVVALLAGTTHLFSAQVELARLGPALYSPAYIMALVALFIVTVAEIGRVPFDNPETHYELTMIHEGMLLEYSGEPLGLLFWASWIKQVLVLSLLANLIFPWNMPGPVTWAVLPAGLGLYLLKLGVVCLAVVLLETTVAKMRLFRVKETLGAAFIVAVIALIFAARQMGGGGLP